MNMMLRMTQEMGSVGSGQSSNQSLRNFLSGMGMALEPGEGEYYSQGTRLDFFKFSTQLINNMINKPSLLARTASKTFKLSTK